MGKKGGERQLTSGDGRPASSGPVSAPAPTPASVPASVKAPEKAAAQDKRDDKKPPVPDPKDLFSDKTQEDFMKVMDEMMKAQESGEEPDPAEVLRIFNEVVPPEIRDQIPPMFLRKLKSLRKIRSAVMPSAAGGTSKKNK